MVHAYTDETVKRAIEAGVKVIEHGQMITEETAKLMAERVRIRIPAPAP